MTLLPKKIPALAISAVAIATALSACGNGHNASAPPSSTTTLQGAVFASSPFITGTVSIYDFSRGTKGTLLQATPIGVDGSYSATITNVPSPVLVEATGCYNETVYWFNGGIPQAPGVISTANPVCLNIGLDAVIATNAGVVTAIVTPLTHAAYGLSQYKIKQGQTAATAVAGANTAVGQMAGFNVVSTTPIYPTKNVTVSSGTVYGGLLSGLSSWLYNEAGLHQSGTTLHVGDTGLATLNIADAMRNDLAHDGVLDGVGNDGVGNALPLSIANTPLSTTVYRHQIAKYAVIALRGAFESTVPQNVTLIKDFLPALVVYNNATGLYDSSVLVTLDEGGPIIVIASPTAGATITGSAGIDGTDHDITGYVNGLQVELLIDGNHYDWFLNPYHPSYSINTLVFPNGLHTLTIEATNNLGTTKSASVAVNFAN
jgi:hypothetical protein